jgi:hypothetical protein
MKKSNFWTGILAITLVFTMAITACGGGDDGGDTTGGGNKDLTGTITISPATATTGQELTATYSGTETVSYQWKNGSTNVGTNSKEFTPETAGSYTVTVSATGYNPKTSAAVTVTVALLNLSGTITISPSTGVNINTKLTATYSGTESVTLTYQWKKGADNVGTNSNEFTPTTAGSYTVTVSASGYNSKTSAAVDVGDSSLSTLNGTITISPATATTGTKLTATYSGSESVTLTYQWKKGTDNVGTNSNEFTPTEAGSYTVTVSASGYNSKTSSNAVTVTSGGSGTSDLTGTITISPNSGVTVNKELTATYSGSETVSYQWKKGTDNVGTDSNKYTPTETGSYTVTVSAAGYNSKTSDAVTVAEAPPSTTAGITIELAGMDEWELTEQSVQAVAHVNKVFTVTETYTAYRWYLNGALVETSSSYTFNKPEGIYQLVVVVKNSNGESRSWRCRVTVEPVFFYEDFEGTTHSFTIVNGSQTNKWYVGTAVANGGAKSAYISNTNGTSNAYDRNSSSTVHMYCDITFPSSTSPYTLAFHWRAQGQDNSDRLRVRLVETSTSITAGSYSGTSLGDYSRGGATTWNQATISIPEANSGTTKRLVFTWINNSGSSGVQPPAAIDNIVLTK